MTQLFDLSGRTALVTGSARGIGFALAEGHLAWASPPGVNAEGSQLWVYAYSGKGAGENSSSAQPGANTVIVVQH